MFMIIIHVFSKWDINCILMNIILMFLIIIHVFQMTLLHFNEILFYWF